MNPGEIIAVAELGDTVLHALANLLLHFAPHTVAFKVGSVIKTVANAGGNVIAVGSAATGQQDNGNPHNDAG